MAVNRGKLDWSKRPELVAEIVRLAKDGHSYGVIADRLRLSRGQVARTLRQARLAGDNRARGYALKVVPMSERSVPWKPPERVKPERVGPNDPAALAAAALLDRARAREAANAVVRRVRVL